MSKEKIKAGAKMHGEFMEFLKKGQMANVRMLRFNKACLDKDGDAHLITSQNPSDPKNPAKYYKIDCMVKVDGQAEADLRVFMMFQSSFDKMNVDLIRQVGFESDATDDHVREIMQLDATELITEEHRACVFIKDADMYQDDFLDKFVFGKTIRCGRPPKSYDALNGFTYYKETFHPEHLLRTEESVKAEVKAACGIVDNMPDDIGGIINA